MPKDEYLEFVGAVRTAQRKIQPSPRTLRNMKKAIGAW
jgi:hypothetical protein